jgi:hypothetical protein
MQRMRRVGLTQKTMTWLAKTGPHDPLSPYVLNHNGRSAYVVYKLIVCVYIYEVEKLSGQYLGLICDKSLTC